MTNAETNEPRMLRYQEQLGLDEVPAYSVGLQLRLTSGDRVYVALSATELALYFEPELALHYDLETRLFKVAERNQYWRRSLSHRVLYSRKHTAEQRGGLDRTALGTEQADALVARAHARVAVVFEELASGVAQAEFGKPKPEEARACIAQLLGRAARFNVAEAHRDAGRFAKVYGRVAVLPPDEYNALVLQATEGCGFGGCLFCKLYCGVHYHAKTPAEFRQHVEEAVAYQGEALRARRSIFLGEANALNAPKRTLMDNLRLLQERFELPPPEERTVPAKWWLGSATRFDGIASFLDVFTGVPHTALDFIELRRFGLRRVYLGMETGDDKLLQWLRKPASAEAIRRTVQSLKEADIAIGVIVLLGAGGLEFSESHVRETVRLLNSLPVGLGDYIYFSPLVIYPGGPYSAREEAANIHRLNAAQMRQQEQEIRAALRFDARHGRPYMARYELETFVY